ncbi:MAG TPA: rhodanese-like domain-containing protein [Thermoanaerobaculia bacterium]|nr:rhodanese-like domain-containing protein [Thermoanaerobaculia bacterium]
MRQRAWTKIVILILAGAACAGVSNLAASKERRLAWIGSDPRALETGAPADAAATAASQALSPTTPVPAPASGASPASPSAASKTFPPHPDRASVEITTDDAEALHRQQRLFLDARRSSVYADGHLSGARSFPVWESDIADRVKAFFDEGLDQNAPIVIYCSGGDCEDSHMLAEKLYMVGFNALFVYKDGFPGWQKRGLPVTKGPKP